MDIRITVMMSIFATALVVSGCASSEESRQASSPSMKEMPSTKDTSVGKMRETTPPAGTSRDAGAPAITKEPRGTSDSRTTVAGDPLQACLSAVSKSGSAGQRSIAEETCRRDFGTTDARAVASGTQGDTLKGCLARIPKEASPGQRMIAEGSCQRDEEVRRGF